MMQLLLEAGCINSSINSIHVRRLVTLHASRLGILGRLYHINIEMIYLEEVFASMRGKW